MGARKSLDSQTILIAAAELAEEKGLENVSLLQVAQRLGVKPPSLYNHLSGLKEISSGLAALALKRLDAAMRDAAVGRAGADALTSIAQAYREFVRENPELYKAIMRFPECDDGDVQESGHAVIRILYQVLQPYRLGDEGTVHFARAFRAALHGFASLETAGFFRDPGVDADESYKRLVSCLLSALDKEKGAQGLLDVLNGMDGLPALDKEKEAQ